MTRDEEVAAIEAYVAAGLVTRITREMLIAYNEAEALRTWRDRMKSQVTSARAHRRSRETRSRLARERAAKH